MALSRNPYRQRDRRWSPTPRQTRVGLVLAMGVLLTVVAGGVFDRQQWPLFVAPVVTVVPALALRTQRWALRLTAHATTVAVAVVAAALLSGGSLDDAFPGVVRGPRRLLTTEWPSPADATIIATIALVLALATAAAAELAALRRFHLAPLTPLVVGLAVLLALGAPVAPATWVLLGLTALALLLALTRADAAPASRTLFGDRTLIASTIGIATAALVASSALALTDRANPRTTQGAELTSSLLDPIEAMVALQQAEPEFDLFEITDRSTLVGQSLPARWRLAALDGYDGQRWVPRLTLRPIGGRLGLPLPQSPALPPRVSYEVVFLSDDLDLVPFPGQPLEVDTDVETDLDRIVVRLAERPEEGRRLRAVSEGPPNLAAARTAVIADRQVDEIAGTFTDVASDLTGDAQTPLEQLQALEQRMQDEFLLDPSAPGGGQQLALIERFVSETRRGTAEQFVTAFVLLARSLGIDARVATGFVVPAERVSQRMLLRSADASIWPEVRLTGVGWLVFDPVPPLETTEEEEPTPPPEEQSPAAAQPPIQPLAEEADQSEDTAIETTDGSGRWGTLQTWLVRSATIGGVAVFPLVATIGTILALKWRRRRRRLQAIDPARRIRGAWANATDSLVDAGLAIAPSWTDGAIAQHATPLAPAAPHEIRRLAAMSTAMTFGPTVDSWRLADDAVSTSRAIDAAIRADRTRWQRLRWKLSLRSLRARTRSPVTP